jgi:hypothetical protein
MNYILLSILFLIPTIFSMMIHSNKTEELKNLRSSNVSKKFNAVVSPIRAPL